jgi:hypothetical protein
MSRPLAVPALTRAGRWVATLEVAVAALVCGLLCPGVSAAQLPPATQDYAVSLSSYGDSVFADLSSSLFPDLSFVVDARSGPSGQNPAGSLNWSFGSAGYNEDVASASVTCLSVAGNRAVIGGFGLRRIGGYLFDPSTNPAPPPENIGFFVVAVDNGQFVADPNDPFKVGPDQAMLIEPAGPTPPNDCSAVSAGTLFLVGGDLVVHDAPAVPSSKDQCKHGGWRNFPGFKSQGQCVRFVRHQARQKCVFERAAIGRAAFRAKYGQGEDRQRAMRGCIKQRISD